MQRDKIEKFIKMQNAGFQIDSRLIKENDVFFALKGERTDGHLFLKEVAEKKAKAAIVSKDFKKLENLNLEIIKVDDVLSVLQDLATKELIDSKAKRIAITGSMGKTTTKEYISILLEGSGVKISKTYKSYNSQAGFPIAILNIDKNVDFLILEMGMDKKNELKKLIKIAPPDIAVLTQLVKYHQHFDDMEELGFAKKEIFSHQRTKIKLINKKLKDLHPFKNEDYLTFSIDDKKADFYLDIKNEYFYEMGKKINIKLPFQETHLLEDLTAAISICRLVNEKYDDIFKQFNLLKSEKLRFEKKVIKDTLFILDCYNALPTATIAALENLPKVKGKKIAVLGSNLGLGKFSNQAHEEIIEVAKKNVDEILCFGDEWKHIKDLRIFSDFESIAKHLVKIMKKDDVVLIKGSNILYMDKILDFIN